MNFIRVRCLRTWS